MPSADPPRFWLRFEHEASHCPACGSSSIELLDVFKIPRDAKGRRVAFVTVCRGCGVIFANPLPTDAELRSHYAADGDATYAAARQRIASRQASEQRAPAAQDERELLLDSISTHVPVRRPRSGAKALDFGCGDGKYLDLLQDAGWETYGIEPSTDAAFTRHRRLDVPPQDQSFDFAMLHHVLEHVTRPLAVLRDIAVALRADAVLFLSVPRLDTLPEHRDFKYCLDGRNHVMAFTEASLRGLLARSGFRRAVTVESPELDALLTGGTRLRLRIAAWRGTPDTEGSRAAYPDAVRALRAYRRGQNGMLSCVSSMVPVRMRGAFLDRAIERRAQERRRARA